MSLDDIWDAPIDLSTNSAPTNDDSSPLKRPRHSLFLPDSDSDNDRPSKRVTPAPPAARPDIDSLFEDLDEDVEDADLRYKPLAPALDLAKLAREAEGKHARASSQTFASVSKTGGADGTGKDQSGKAKPGDGDKSGRKVLLKLDEERLVGAEGFPSLVQNIKGFRSKGKGNEHADLNQLLQVYQFWTHRIYPKTSFKDTINRVEKLCHSKRMQVRLSVWRDEFKSVTKDTEQPDDPDVIDLTEPTLVAGTEQKGKGELELQTDQKVLSSSDPDASAMDVDEASLWEAFDDPGVLEPSHDICPPVAPVAHDSDMWDIVDEIQQGEQRKLVKGHIPLSGVNDQPLLENTGSTACATNYDDWEDMYS